MRISGYGPGGQGQPDSGRDRAASFRARHSVGQRIKGRILRREQSGLYWVQVGGEELLARLEVQAEPGDQLMFLVRELSPEIMLQALPGGGTADDLPGLIQRFRAAREVFEQQDHGLLDGLAALPPSPARRVEAFQSAVAKSAAAGERLAKVLAILGQINADLDPSFGIEALYLPWLLPGVRRMEAWRRGESAALSAASSACGGIEARLSRTGEGCVLRLLCQNPAASGPLQVEAAALVRESRGLEAEIVVAPLTRPTPRGGVLGELFGDMPAWSSGGLNTRV